MKCETRSRRGVEYPDSLGDGGGCEWSCGIDERRSVSVENVRYDKIRTSEIKRTVKIGIHELVVVGDLGSQCFLVDFVWS